MIFTLPVFLTFYTLLLSFFVIYTTSHNLLSLGYILPDLIFRLDLNSVGLTGFYWLWTNTYYLYSIFIFVIYMFVTFVFSNKYTSYMYIVITYSLLLLLEAIYNMNLVSSIDLEFEYMTLYNLLLNNSINKIHPALIYLALVSSLVSFSNLSLSDTNYRLLIYTLFNLIVILVSLILGGWWAYQEGSWGGWWNWDASEMFGLFILTTLLIFSHTLRMINFQYVSFIRNVTILLLLYYSFLQLNFSLISHNFGIRQGDLVDFRILYLSLFFIALVYVIKSNYRFIASGSPIQFLNSKTFVTLNVLYLLLASIAYVTTSELWSNLTWSMLSIDIQNEYKLTDCVNLYVLAILTVIYTIFYMKPVPTLILLLYIPDSILVWPFINAFINKLRSFRLRTHVLTSLTLLTLIMYSRHSLTTSSMSLLPLDNTLSLNLPLIECCNATFSNISDYSCSVGSRLSSNTIDTKMFNLINGNYLSSQNYNINDYDVTVSSCVIDWFNLLPLIVAALIATLNNYFFDNNIIKF